MLNMFRFKEYLSLSIMWLLYSQIDEDGSNISLKDTRCSKSELLTTFHCELQTPPEATTLEIEARCARERKPHRTRLATMLRKKYEWRVESHPSPGESLDREFRDTAYLSG